MARLRVLVVVVGLALLAAPTASNAAAAAPANPVADCNATGTLTHQYSVAVLQHALKTLPVDVKEYTDCYDVIQRALLAQVGGHHARSTGDSHGGGGSVLPTPVIVVIVLLALAAATFGALALRRRGRGGEPPRTP
jgi:hypothetical protein